MENAVIFPCDAQRLADGVADRVVALAELDAETRKLAQCIAANGPVAVRAAKRAIERGADLSMDAGMASATEFVSIQEPPPRPTCKFIEGEPKEMAGELVRLLREEAKIL